MEVPLDLYRPAPGMNQPLFITIEFGTEYEPVAII